MLKLLFLLLSIPISGIVTNQHNGKGVEGVVVSDGYHCTVTDSKGRYFLDADSLARTVSITVPAEYMIPLGDDGAPAFFKYIGGADLNFSLTPRKKSSDRFTLIAVSDAHFGHDNSFERFNGESVPDIQRTMESHSSYGPVIGVALGDQLSDRMEFTSQVKPSYTGFRASGNPVPFFYCIGNHDHDNTGGKSEYAVTEHFVRNFAPTDYSFDIGKVHFVVMDDILYKGTQRDGVKIAYDCGISDSQLEWLRQDLALVKDKKDKVIVFCIHAALFGRFLHKDEVKELLGSFREALVLSGHEHNINNFRHAGNIREYNLQSIGGAWWFSNLSPSGCPLGYGVFSFDGSALSEQYNKTTTEDAGFQMRVYSGNDSYGPDRMFTGLKGAPKRSEVYGWPEEFKGCFVARIWDATPDWEVKFVQGGVETPMKQIRKKCFDAASAAFMVDVFGAPYGGSRVYKQNVDTFWIIEAPSGDPAAEKDWEIVATHTMPSGRKVEYRSRILMRDYRGFQTGTRYLRDYGRHPLLAAASALDLGEVLVSDRSWMPYPAYSDREGWDRLLGGRKKDFISRGEEFLGFEWLQLRATDYLELDRTGNRCAQEDRMHRNREALSMLMMAELAEGKGRFVDDIINGVFSFCEYTSWAVSDHLAKFQQVKSPLPDYKEHILALFQGNHAQMLSWIWYFFHETFDGVNPVISERLYHEIKQRELDPYLQKNHFDWMGFRAKVTPNNWNPWCNSNALLCFMLLETDRERLKAAVEKSIVSVDRYLESLKGDGACDEGPIYWYVSGGYLLNYLQCLSMVTGGKLQIWDSPLLKNFGEYIVHAQIGGKWHANFADAEPSETPGAATIWRYGKAFGSSLMRDFAVYSYKAFCYDPLNTDWSLFYKAMENFRACTELSAEPQKEFKPSDFAWYSESELCFMRSGKGYLAVKGGNNHERHNHNDVGSCIYFYDGKPVLVDAGKGTYNKFTFDKKYRYKIWNMSSDYHNVPRINGCAEEYGRAFKASGSAADKRTKSFTADIASAYPDSAGVKSWKLHYRLLKDGSLEIRGDFELEHPAVPNELHFLLPEEPDLSCDGVAGLNAGVCLRYDKAAFEANSEKIPLEGSGIGEAFGDALWRLSLKAKSVPKKGSYVLRFAAIPGKGKTVKEELYKLCANQCLLLGGSLAPLTMPQSYEDGKLVCGDLKQWTSGFFPGTCWYAWQLSGRGDVLELAKKSTEPMLDVDSYFRDHDVGFQVMCSAGLAYRLTGEKKYLPAIRRGAELLSSRFQPVCGTIMSWDSSRPVCKVIIDNMMNLELLTFASRLFGVPEWEEMAKSHADVTMANHFREDASSYHLLEYDLTTGEVLVKKTVQGFSDGSSWSRGQSWGLYGYTMMYRETGEKRYLHHAEKIARYLLPLLKDRPVPSWDFSAPQPMSSQDDASAAAVMASAFIELSTLTKDKALASRCIRQAEATLEVLSSPGYLSAKGENGGFLIKHGTGFYMKGKEVDAPLSYADYYYLEALYRYKVKKAAILEG